MPKSARGSSENLFSINGAAEALGRTRRTISRALADIPADAVRSGLKLWTMKKIIAAVNERTQAPVLETARQGSSVLTGKAAECAVAFQRFDEADAAMRRLESLTARRAAAHDLAPLLREAIELMAERDLGNGLDPEHVELRGDKIRLLCTRGLERPCQWNFDQAWHCLVSQGDDEEDEAA